MPDAERKPPPDEAPEIASSADHYRATIDLDDLNNAHSIAILSVPPGSRVLDVGCAHGDVAAALAGRGCTVWGVELDEAAARDARAQCADVAVGDIERLDVADRFPGIRFDAVLFLDVLEHLRDPSAVLRRSSALLAEKGVVIVSIPNVTHGSVRLEILRGRFRYRDKGILDRTHLRFFDLPAVERLIEDAGFVIQDRLRVTRRLHETEIDVDPAKFPDGVIDRILEDPEALTYQYVVVAAPAAASAAEVRAGEEPSLTERLQTRVAELTRLVRDGETYVRSLESRIQELLPLRDRVAELEAVESERAYLQKDVLVKNEYLAELRTKLEAAQRRLDSELGPALEEAQTLRAVLQQPRHRIADRVNDTLKRFLPGIQRLLKVFTRSPA